VVPRLLVDRRGCGLERGPLREPPDDGLEPLIDPPGVPPVEGELLAGALEGKGAELLEVLAVVAGNDLGRQGGIQEMLEIAGEEGGFPIINGATRKGTR
jgi:hypothetical protein